jgi:phage terminase large subunit GpA-like protein
MHWYRSVRSDYLDQLTAEVKAPARDQRRPGRMKKVWQVKAGKENHGLDATIYALHAARALRIDTFSTGRWAQIRERLFQGHLFATAAAAGTESGAAVAETAVVQAAEMQGEGAAGGVQGIPAQAVQMSVPPPVAPVPPLPKPAAQGQRRRVRSTGIRL